MAKRVSITRALVVFIAGIFVVSSIVSGWMVFRSLDKTMHGMLRGHIENEAKDIEQNLLSILELHEVALTDLAQAPVMTQALLQPETHAGQLGDFLDNAYVLGAKPYLTLLNFDADVVYATNVDLAKTYRGAEWVQEVLKHNRKQRRVHFNEGKAHWLMAKPIVYDGLVDGVLVAEFPTQLLEPHLKGYSHRNDLSFHLRLNDQLVMSSGQSVSGVTIQYALSDMSLVLDVTGNSNLIDSARTLLIEQFSWLIPLLACGVLVITVALALKIFVKPIVELQESVAHHVPGQALVLPQESSSILEIGDLRDSVEAMNKRVAEHAAELSALNQDLEARVSERSREYQIMAEESHRANKLKSEFLANMSHELRTPLNSILLLSEMLESTYEEGTKEKKFAGTIKNSGQGLLTMINDLLDIAKIESGKMEIVISDVILEVLRDSVVAELEPLATQKGLAFSVDIAEGAPASIQTDYQRICQVLKNLISNAIKFTAVGRVDVRMYAAEDGGLGIDVQDTGIGIAEDKLELIFESFRQVDGTITRDYGGTGLGLSLSREIMNMLGGTISLRSEVGEGSCFTVVLSETPPVHEKPKPLVQKHSALSDEHKTDLADLHICVVDDDHRNIFALAEYLRDHVAEVSNASSGKQCLDLLEAGHGIQVCLVDLMMPGMDGVTLIRRIREKHPACGIIALSADVREKNHEAAVTAGAFGFLPKPVDAGELGKMLVACKKRLG